MLQPVPEQPNTHEVSRKGQQIFEALSPGLEKDHYGRFIAIEVDSEEHFLGETGIEATQRAQAKHPGKIFFLGKIGYRTAYTFKGRR